MQFQRLHHRRIAQVLAGLNAALLREHRCYFGGGTAIALRFGEYRESVDIDFLVSDLDSYRGLRQVLTGPLGWAALNRETAKPDIRSREVRADQYGIRTVVQAEAQIPIKFEIVFEARIALEIPGARDDVCGVASLTPLDMAATKLLANSDRWADDAVFSRDLIDLAMMQPALPLLRAAVKKAHQAYGGAVLRDLAKAIDYLQVRDGRLERCISALAIKLPTALLWQRISALKRVLA